MGLTEKIVNALQKRFCAAYIRLDVDDGISGIVARAAFEQMFDSRPPANDRRNALRNAADPLSNEEQRQILMIAGLTPQEYESAVALIRVHEIRELSDRSLEVLLHGTYWDATYVRVSARNQRGVTATEPEQSPDAIAFSWHSVRRDPC